MEEDIDDYILSHIDAEGDLLAQLDHDTHLRILNPRMCSGHLQGRMLKMFVRMIRPRRILEIGTFTGYSALCLAEGLDDGGEVHTVEIDDELEDFIRSHVSASPFAGRIHIHIGDAASVVPTIDGDFDLAFIDADKREYCEHYSLVFPRVRAGGFIIADNTLWDGKVVNLGGKKLDAQTAGILRFNDMIASDSRVEKVILPVRDGLTIIHKK
jgi:caffeoyl-CoA O-methyltransferase